MDNFHVYKDMEARTGGEIYIGVVGPVRTGKSTFIKRFVEQMVLPNLEDENVKARTRDEMPQSATGTMIMTTEPKFIPKEAAKLTLEDGAQAKVRLIDCVGFMVEGAAGHRENDAERLVKTPWFDYEIPFTQAAEIGTQKVIREHSTIGIVVTCDGSFGDIKREHYRAAEEKTVAELKDIGKPFIVLLNSERPFADETKNLARSMAVEYGVTVLPVNCEQLRKDDITKIMEKILGEFPVAELDFYIPKWLEILPDTHWLKNKMIEKAKAILKKVTVMRDVTAENLSEEDEAVKEVLVKQICMADGRVDIGMEVDHNFYYQILSEYVGLPIEGEYQLMQTLKELAGQKGEYEKVQAAMNQVRLKGYGVVTPERSEIILDEPQIVKHGNKYGVKMKAEAPSVNLIKAHIETEIAPIVGSEQQAQDLIAYIKENSKESEEGIWSTNIFGKSIEQIVEDGIQAKVSQMTEECQMKLQDTLQKIINDSNGGMICIII
ncbi:MAG: stage IV sporulation protein A [bacterium]|nr:stage IV sporulation protein A [bacterium]